MTFDRILVPLDGSRQAERALMHACRMARAFGSRVLLLRVLDTRSSLVEPCPDSIDWRLRRLEAVRYLRAAARHPALDGLEAEWHLTEGRPAEQIMQFIRAQDIGLVVLNAHGEGGAFDFPFGGTAQKLSTAPGVSLVVVRDGEGPAAEAPQYRRILMPLDGSRRAEWALNVVVGMTAGLATEIVLLQVVPPPEMPPRHASDKELLSLCDRLIECSRRAARAYLSEIRARYGSGVQLHTRLVVSGRISQTILEVAEEEDADLIVLVAHEADDELPSNHNSVCQHILGRSERPVLVLHHDRMRTEHPQAWLPAPRSQRLSERLLAAT